MTNEGLAVLIAGFAKLLAGIIMHATAYIAGDLRPEARAFHVKKANELSEALNQQTDEIIAAYRATKK